MGPRGELGVKGEMVHKLIKLLSTFSLENYHIIGSFSCFHFTVQLLMFLHRDLQVPPEDQAVGALGDRRLGSI